jgi:signal transduction histidine kinase
MELIISELAANAILHTPSGHAGGEFTVTVKTGPGWARIEVSDTGAGQWDASRAGAGDDEHGRGLAIVAALADKLGHDIRAGGQTVWAEVSW